MLCHFILYNQLRCTVTRYAVNDPPDRIILLRPQQATGHQQLLDKDQLHRAVLGNQTLPLWDTTVTAPPTKWSITQTHAPYLPPSKAAQAEPLGPAHAGIN